MVDVNGDPKVIIAPFQGDFTMNGFDPGDIKPVDYLSSSVKLFNMYGEEISLHREIRNDSLEYTLNDNLPDGVYSLIVEAHDNDTMGEVWYKRFIIHENASDIKLINNETTQTFTIDHEIINLVNNTINVIIKPIRKN